MGASYSQQESVRNPLFPWHLPHAPPFLPSAVKRLPSSVGIFPQACSPRMSPLQTGPCWRRARGMCNTPPRAPSPLHPALGAGAGPGGAGGDPGGRTWAWGVYAAQSSQQDRCSLPHTPIVHVEQLTQVSPFPTRRASRFQAQSLREHPSGTQLMGDTLPRASVGTQRAPSLMGDTPPRASVGTHGHPAHGGHTSQGLCGHSQGPGHPACSWTQH